MAQDAAYRAAEQKIEETRKSGATELDLSYMKLTELPESIGHLTQLQSLDLHSNHLTALPRALGRLTQLQWMNLSDNQLTKLPETLGHLTQLQSLNLNFNRLTALPRALGQLTWLQWMNLSANQLTELPETLGQLTRLQSLDLNHNQLTALPEALGQLTQLQSLYLSHNQLTTLPETLIQLTRLQSLDLNHNQLTALPEALSQLTRLQMLDLNHNQLTALPEALGQLTRLQTLLLFHNQLTDLPASLAKLEHLKYLEYFELDDNPLNPELEAAYEQGLDAVMAYLRAKAEAQIVLNEAKLILIGDGEVGKTSLLAALRGEAWVEDRTTTHGVEVDIKSLTLTDPDSGTEITLNGWDFGGQNIYRHTHQLFFTAPAVYLAVWNPRRGPEQCRVGEWIKMVKHRAYDENRPDERPRIIVVATHGGPKERLDHIDEQALRDEFDDLIIGFLHVDSKPDADGVCYGLEDLKTQIARAAASIPQVGRAVPASWKRVLDAVRQRGEQDAWITYEQFQTLCAEQQVALDLARTYAAILNELGHLIYYADDPVLKDTMILKPEWLSKAISFILEDKQVKEQNGLVAHSRLSELWDDPARGADRYPAHLHPVFLKLMERFDLSYRVVMPEAEAPDTSLVAQLVPGGRSDGWEEDWGPKPKPGDTERTQVCRVLDAETGRTVEAEGLMYRLIVRLHRYSLGRTNYCLSRHWKTGLILDDGFNGRAFLEDIAGDVYITVRAAYPERFLSHLCAEVQWLVDAFWKGLDGRFYIPCPTPSCKGLLELDEMIANRNEGMPKIRCSVCRQFHEIDALLTTPAPKPEWQDAVAQLTCGQQQIMGALDTGFGSLSVQLRTIMSQADEQYAALLTTLIDPAKDGPRLFSFQPANAGFWDKPDWVSTKFRLTLWCEHSRLPLPVLEPFMVSQESFKALKKKLPDKILSGLSELENQEFFTEQGFLRAIASKIGADQTGKYQNVILKQTHKADQGVYTIELTRDWLKRAAPVLRAISMTLSLALPLASPAIKLATDDVQYKAFDEQLSFGLQASETFLEGSGKAGNWLTNSDDADLEKTREAIRAEGSALRELHAILRNADPAGGLGGLARVQNKRREFLWVHPKFAGEY